MPPDLRELRAKASLQELDGYGGSIKGRSLCLRPNDLDELKSSLILASNERLSVCFRGAGCSYSDAAVNDGGLVIDTTRLNRILHWDPETGTLNAQAGLSIEGVWRRTIEEGFWPAVVPGSMQPTLGGCLAMNVHGKNNYRVGPFGNHIEDLDLLTAEGKILHCSRQNNSDLFYASVGGLGLLGAILRVRVRLKRIHSGNLRVQVLCGRNLDETFDQFEKRLPCSDYLVGWIDCTASGQALGRGVLHAANHLLENEDPEAWSSLKQHNQDLPSSILGLPKSLVWRFMRPFTNRPGISLVNFAKFLLDLNRDGRQYLQSHVAFAFLLDHVPNWRLAYGPSGFIQYQLFVPNAQAKQCIREVLSTCLLHNMPSFLGVLKRHKADDFLLSHGLDGWSLAMDFAVDPNRTTQLTHELTKKVLDAGGTFYFAKDCVLKAADIELAYGKDRLDKFRQLKARLDPQGLFESQLSRRLLLSD